MTREQAKSIEDRIKSLREKHNIIADYNFFYGGVSVMFSLYDNGLGFAGGRFMDLTSAMRYLDGVDAVLKHIGEFYHSTSKED